GDPKVNSLTPATGPADGGTKVTIKGENLGCVTGVFFGGIPATKVSNNVAYLDCNSTTEVTATAPSSTAGHAVRVSVTTAESDATGSGPSTDMVLFRYTHPARPTLT